MKKHIHTIEELEKEQKELRMAMSITGDAFIESLSKSRKQAVRFFLENIAIPAGVLGLGTIAVKKFSTSDGQENQEKQEKRKINYLKISKKLFPIALNMLQAFLLKRQKEKMHQHLTGEAAENPSNS